VTALAGIAGRVRRELGGAVPGVHVLADAVQEPAGELEDEAVSAEFG
jgi:hypothetical protein